MAEESVLEREMWRGSESTSKSLQKRKGEMKARDGRKKKDRVEITAFSFMLFFHIRVFLKCITE